MKMTVSPWQGWQIIAVKQNFIIRHLEKIVEHLKVLEGKNLLKIAFDFSETTYIDSSSISYLINLMKRMKEKNGKVVVFGANKEVGEIFSIITFDELVPVYKNRAHFEQSVKAEETPSVS